MIGNDDYTSEFAVILVQKLVFFNFPRYLVEFESILKKKHNFRMLFVFANSLI